jgi:hypothetical protein
MPAPIPNQLRAGPAGQAIPLGAARSRTMASQFCWRYCEGVRSTPARHPYPGPVIVACGLLTAPRNDVRHALQVIISSRTPPRCARAPQIPHPTWSRCASACRPIPESRVARARLAGGCLETLIGPAFRPPHRPLTQSSRCSRVSSAPRFDCRPFRKRLCPESLQPVGHAAPGGLLNPWQTNTSFPRDPAGAAATSRVILDAQPRRRPQMKGIPSGERLMPWL